MSRTRALPGMADEVIEELSEKLLLFNKKGKQAQRVRKDLGEIKDSMLEVMDRHKKTVYVDAESGYTVTVSKKKTLKVSAPAEEKPESENEASVPEV